MAVADCHLTLRARTGVQFSRKQLPTGSAATIPVWKSVSGGRSKYLDMRESERQRCLSMRVDLARRSSKSGRTHVMAMSPFFIR
jgi:hypothetical protein